MIFFEQLNELIEAKSLVDVRREDLKADDIRGFILATSAKLVLVGVVGDDIRHDGYTIIELDDITFLRWGTDFLLDCERLLGGPAVDGPTKEPDLSSWWGALETARASATLVTFYRERLDSDLIYISDAFQYSDVSITGRQVNSIGRRNGSFAIRSDDLTRIDFGGRYEGGRTRILKLD